MKNHILKIWPEFFQAVIDGRKPFEVRQRRRGDQRFAVGDRVMLREYDPNREVEDRYTGRFVFVRVTYVLPLNQLIKVDVSLGRWAVLGIEDWNKGGRLDYAPRPPVRIPRTYELKLPWIGPSANKFFARAHWTRRNEVKEDAYKAASVAKSAAKIPAIGFPVNLIFTPFLPRGRRIFDTSNYSLTGKMIEDGLVKARVFVDDRAEFVRRVSWNPGERTAEKHGFVKLIIEEALP